MTPRKPKSAGSDAILEAIGWKEDVNHEAANRAPR